MKYAKFSIHGMLRPLGVFNNRTYWSRGYDLYSSAHDFKDIQIEARYPVKTLERQIAKIQSKNQNWGWADRIMDLGRASEARRVIACRSSEIVGLHSRARKRL